MVTAASAQGTTTLTSLDATQQMSAPASDVAGTVETRELAFRVGPEVPPALLVATPMATQTVTGTSTLDSEQVISTGHPVIYNVSVSGG